MMATTALGGAAATAALPPPPPHPTPSAAPLLQQALLPAVAAAPPPAGDREQHPPPPAEATPSALLPLLIVMCTSPGDEPQGSALTAADAAPEEVAHPQPAARLAVPAAPCSASSAMAGTIPSRASRRTRGAVRSLPGSAAAEPAAACRRRGVPGGNAKKPRVRGIVHLISCATAHSAAPGARSTFCAEPPLPHAVCKAGPSRRDQ